MRWIALVMVLLAACGGGEADPGDTDNHGYGWGYDVQSASGIKIRSAGSSDPLTFLEPKAVGDFFDRHFESVANCVGIDAAPPPYVIFVRDGSLGQNVGGGYAGDPPLILISYAGAFRHEVVHYLLHLSTGNFDAEHGSAFFSACA